MLMFKHVPFAALALVSLLGCAVDDTEEPGREREDEPAEAPPALQNTVYKEYPVTNVWKSWVYFDDVGYKVRAFEGNYDGHIDIQFVATRTPTQYFAGKAVRVYYACSNAAGQRDNFYVDPGKTITLSQHVGVGSDILDAAICAPGKRPIDVYAIIDIHEI